MPARHTNLLANDTSSREMALNQPSSQTKQSMQKLLFSFYYTSPNLEISRIDPLPSAPHRAYILTTNNGYYTLKMAPPSGARIMRHESECPTAEGKILNLIEGSNIPIPKVIGEDSGKRNHVRSPFLLRIYIPGDPLSSVAHRFTSFDLAQIDQKVGRYIRLATNFKQNQFGPSSKVLAGQGLSNWRTAFQTLMEMALRDAEDVYLSIPFTSIRGWVGHHLGKLDVVKEAHLVPLRSGSPDTVIVDSNSNTLVGIVGWTDVVWGDPMLGEAFDNPSAEFWVGFGDNPTYSYFDGHDLTRHMM